MTCTQALVSLFLLAPCADGGGGHHAATAAVTSAARPATDMARDAGRKPDEVLSFFAISPGMTVLEVFAGGGYYTQILDGLVGSNGKLIAHNNQAYLDFVGPQFEQRFTDGHLPNTERLIAEANEISLPDQSLDAALLVLAYHDFLFGEEQYNWLDADEQAFIQALCRSMKPGAVLGVIDHVAASGGDAGQIAQGLHRIDPARVKADLADSCFELQGQSYILRNPADDHSTSATQGPLKGKTDRFVLKYVRK